MSCILIKVAPNFGRKLNEFLKICPVSFNRSCRTLAAIIQHESALEDRIREEILGEYSGNPRF